MLDYPHPMLLLVERRLIHPPDQSPAPRHPPHDSPFTTSIRLCVAYFGLCHLFPLLYLYVLCLSIFHPPRGPLVVGKRKRQPSRVFSIRPYVCPSDSLQGSSTASDNCILLRLCMLSLSSK